MRGLGKRVGTIPRLLTAEMTIGRAADIRAYVQTKYNSDVGVLVRCSRIRYLRVFAIGALETTHECRKQRQSCYAINYQRHPPIQSTVWHNMSNPGPPRGRQLLPDVNRGSADVRVSRMDAVAVVVGWRRQPGRCHCQS